MGEGRTFVVRGLTATNVGSIIEFDGIKGLLRNVEYLPLEGKTHVDLVLGIDLDDTTLVTVRD